jgi:hypothetical protein
VAKATECPGCTKAKPRWQSLCPECLETYGNAAAGWPEWLRFATNYDRRRRYGGEAESYHEITASALGVDADELRADLRTNGDKAGSARGLVPSYVADGQGTVQMPFAPYEDEAMNRLYRKANGIKPNADRRCYRKNGGE